MPYYQVEALACGKSVINTDLTTGVPEVSLDNQTGLTVPVGDTVRLSSAIKLLWEDNDLRQRFGQEALKRAETVYSKDRFKTDLKEALLKIK